ncbi:ABC transporter [Streptomyces mangrovi]|uniref:ABC transporter n=1 Tax=Streptomyces mangrovi TaxID=1206892 RepID=UPI0036D3ED1D
MRRVKAEAAAGAETDTREAAGRDDLGTLLRSLVRPVWRTLPRRALATAGVLGLLLAGSTRLPDQAPDEELGLLVLRVIALVGALGLAFLLDDPARNTSAAAPVGRVLRTALRLGLAAPLAAVWWTTAVLLIPSAARPHAALVTLEAAATAVGALALATTAVRFTDFAEVGRNTAIRLGSVAAVMFLVPSRWGLLTTPEDRWWEATHLRWAVLLLLTLAICTAWTPEPLKRRRHGRPTGA